MDFIVELDRLVFGTINLGKFFIFLLHKIVSVKTVAKFSEKVLAVDLISHQVEAVLFVQNYGLT
jgi:hypothetical protein